MTDLDLERLGDVWRQPPDSGELDELKRASERVRRRARWAQAVDVGAAVLVGGIVLLLVLANPEPDTLLVGGAALTILLVSQVRHRKVRQIELMSLTGTTEELLDQSIRRIRTTLRYNRFSLLALGPALLIGYLLASAVGRGSTSLLDALGEDSMLRAGWIGMALLVVAGLALALLRSIRRQRRELGRLVAMRKFYQDETDITTS